MFEIGQPLLSSIPFSVLSPHIEEFIIDNLTSSNGNETLYDGLAFRAILSLSLRGLLPYSKRVFSGLCYTAQNKDRQRFLWLIGYRSEWKELFHAYLAEELKRDVYTFRDGFLAQLPDWAFEKHGDAIRAKFNNPDLKTRQEAIEGILTETRVEKHLRDLMSFLRVESSGDIIERTSRSLLRLPEPKLLGMVSLILDNPNDLELFRKSFYLLSLLSKETIRNHKVRLCQR